MKKILFLENIPSPYRIDFFNEVGKHCELTVLFENRKIAYRNDSWLKDNCESFRAVFMTKKKLGKIAYCPEVKRFLTKEFDHIVVGVYNTPTSIYAMHVMKERHIPFFISVDGGIIREQESFLRYHLKKHLLGSAKHWLSSSTSTDDYLMHYGAKAESIHRYHFTSLLEKNLQYADQLVLNKQLLREKRGMTEKSILLTVGRFNLNQGYGKGYDTFMHVAECLRNQDIGIYFVGDQPTPEFLNWKEKEGLSHVHFIGFMDYQALSEYYAAADLFVLLTRSDVWGLVINEAMSFSLPVITTNRCVAGLELVRNDENGFIVPVNSVEETTMQILHCLKPENLHRMGVASRNRIASYTIETMAQQHLQVWESDL